jgi:hypothetical protein
MIVMGNLHKEQGEKVFEEEAPTSLRGARWKVVGQVP